VDFHHDHAPVHDASRVREFLAKKFITKSTPSILFTSLSPTQFLDLYKLKNVVKEQRSAVIPDSQRNVTLL
jgi:hypothetical protein